MPKDIFDTVAETKGDIFDQITPRVAVSTPSDDRTATQVAKDQLKAVIEGTGLSGLGSPIQAGKQILQHPLDTATGILASPFKAIQNVGENTIPNLVRGGASLLEAYGGPKSPFGGPPTAQENIQAAQGAGQALTAAPVLTGELAALKAAPAAAKGAFNLLPNMAKPRLSLLDQIVGQDPIPSTQIGPRLAQINKLNKHGSTLPPVIRRMNEQLAQGPINYESGRMFATKLGQLSQSEYQALDKPLKAQMKQLGAELKTANRVPADAAGLGETYDTALKLYHSGMKLQDAVRMAAKYAPYIAGGSYVGRRLLRDLTGP